MIINILDPKFRSKVNCDTITEDFYPVENLISDDPQKSSLGFMAYSIVKPPVTVDFEFICTVQLLCIKIWPKIGSLKSTSFDVWTDFNKIKTRIGTCKNLMEDGVIFLDKKEEGCKRIEEIITKTENFKKCFFFRSEPLKSANNISIVIRNTSRCNAVIKKIEIWVRPSGDLRPNEIIRIMECLKSTDLTEGLRKVCPIDNKQKVQPELRQRLDLPELVIPEEFIDAITFEIMALPIVLPSGKAIDQSTLLKCTKAQETMGQIPHDPFTGRIYTTTCKPILDAVLKSRIDKYLLNNQDRVEVKFVPRTVGNCDNSCVNSNGKRDCVQSVSELNLNSRGNVSRVKRSRNGTDAKQSLDEAIMGALQNIPRYTRPADIMEQAKNHPICSVCDRRGETLYRIPICVHFICRPCLLENNKESKCGHCGLPYRKDQVNRYHIGQRLSHRAEENVTGKRN